MEHFKDFLIEASTVAMAGNIGSEGRGLRHVSNYVFPYLSHDQRKESLKNMHLHMNADNLTDENKKKYTEGSHGNKHNPESLSTHELALPHKDNVTGTVYSADTPVKIHGVRHDDKGVIYAQTTNHGEIPLSKIKKPGELKKPVITKGGFDVENKLAKNLGTVAAGSTGTAYDYSYRGNEPGGIRGKARKIDDDKPVIRGESKQNKASMGLTVIKHDPETKTWSFGKDKPHLAEVFEKAKHPTSGLPILEHLNKHHSDGRMENGFTTESPKGSVRSYLAGLGVNSLHLHLTHKKKGLDHGTTYTIGDDNDLKGKTNLSHLSNKDIDKLDHKLSLEKSTVGSIRIVHKPNYETFRNYANNSKTAGHLHKDLTDSNHANEFRQHVDNHISEKNKYSLLPEKKPKAAKTLQKQVGSSTPKAKLLSKLVSTKPVSQNKNVQKLAKSRKIAASSDNTVGGFNW